MYRERFLIKSFLTRAAKLTFGVFALIEDAFFTQRYTLLIIPVKRPDLWQYAHRPAGWLPQDEIPLSGLNLIPRS